MGSPAAAFQFSLVNLIQIITTCSLLCYKQCREEDQLHLLPEQLLLLLQHQLLLPKQLLPPSSCCSCSCCSSSCSSSTTRFNGTDGSYSRRSGCRISCWTCSRSCSHRHV